MKILAFHAHVHDPLSVLIKAEMRSQYCHGAVLIDAAVWREKVASQFSVPLTGHLIIEEFYPKVRTRLLALEELSEIDVFDVPSHTEEKEAKSMDYMIGQIVARLPYDIPDLFRFVPQFRAILGETKDDAWKRHQFCSQFVFNSYRIGNTRLLNCHDYEFSPDKMSWSPFVVPAPKLT
jgi:hypothetical protein